MHINVILDPQCACVIFVGDSTFWQTKLEPEDHSTLLSDKDITKLRLFCNTSLSDTQWNMLCVSVVQTVAPLFAYRTKFPSFWKSNLVALLLAVLLDHMYWAAQQTSNSPLSLNLSLYLPLSDLRVPFDSKVASQMHRSLKQFPMILSKTRETEVFILSLAAA